MTLCGKAEKVGWNEKVELKQDKINFISLNSSLGHHPQKGAQTSQDLHTFCNIFEFASIV
jgi:hypothetical protein